MSYYRVIDGQKYDKQLLEAAERLTSGAKDGRISKADADELLELVKDGDSYTEIEKATVEYIRANFKWTDAADAHFRAEIEAWQGQE